jgi:anti-sigma factor RsiW
MVNRAQVRREKPKKVDTCKQATTLILNYLMGELDSKTARSFEEHLMICPDCVAFLNTYKKTIQFSKSLQYDEIPNEMKKRIREFLRNKIKLGLDNS